MTRVVHSRLPLLPSVYVVRENAHYVNSNIFPMKRHAVQHLGNDFYFSPPRTHRNSFLTTGKFQRLQNALLRVDRAEHGERENNLKRNTTLLRVIRLRYVLRFTVADITAGYWLFIKRARNAR